MTYEEIGNHTILPEIRDVIYCLQKEKEWSRYISVRNGGEEIYVETIPVSGNMKELLPAAKLRLQEIQRIMPQGKWSITIEQRWIECAVAHFEELDVVTGKFQDDGGRKNEN